MTPDTRHPKLLGVWTLLQERNDRLLWQRDETEGAARTWFYIVRGPQQLVYDTYDEAEGMFEAME